MRCQESQIMCSKRKAYSYASICAYIPSYLDSWTNKMESDFLLDSCGRSLYIIYIQAIYHDPSCQYQHWKFVLYMDEQRSRTPSFLFMAVSFCNATLWKKEKVMEKQEGINNCEECGMFNGTLGPYVDWLFRFLLCNSSRSLLVQLPHSSFLKLLMEMNRSVLYWVVSTSREQYSLSMARACF